MRNGKKHSTFRSELRDMNLVPLMSQEKIGAAWELGLPYCLPSVKSIETRSSSTLVARELQTPELLAIATKTMDLRRFEQGFYYSPTQD